MNLVYLADTHIPSRATNGIQIMRMCAAFGGQGADVTLVHPRRFGNRPEGYTGDIWSFYSVPQTFRIVTLPAPLTLRLAGHRRFARTARGTSMAAWLGARSRPGAEPFAVYSRSLLGAWLALRARRFWGTRSACRGVFIEMHDAAADQRTNRLLDQVDGVVAISSALRDHLIAAQPRLIGRVSVEHDGVEARLIARPDAAPMSVRERLGIELDTTVVGYTGRVNAPKGVATLLGAADRLSSSPVRFLVVGKVYDDLDAGAERRFNVTFTGFVRPADVSSYVAASDILVMPTSARLSYSRFTSPLKLFEYMASGRPVVCSDLPVLREIVTHEHNALLVPPDDAVGLTAALERLRADPALGARLAEQAQVDVARFTWDERAGRILGTIGDAEFEAERDDQ